MNLNVIKNAFGPIVGKVSKTFNTHGSGIMTGVGIGGVVVTVVIACVATTKIDPVLDRASERVKKAKEIEDTKEQSKEMVKAYGATAVDFAKLYAPSVLVGVSSIGMILGGRHILVKRNAALMSTCAALTESFNEYRKRVIADVGAEKDLEYYHGIKKTTNVVVDENSNTVSVEDKYSKVNPSVSIYARMFDETNLNHTKNANLNIMFLKGVQDEMNCWLKAKGHVFLNEVYDRLGFPRSEAGQFVGWVYNGHNGDNIIDFGMYDCTDPNKVNFLKGAEPGIYLDFNVDGDIMYILHTEKEDKRIEEWCKNQ